MIRTQRDSPRRPCAAARLLAVAAAAGALACADEPAGPDGQPFGRIGEVRIEVVSPTIGGPGALTHEVVWSSRGPWRSAERITYASRLGDETVLSSTGDVGSLARNYAAWVDLVNDTPSVSLFTDLVDPALEPDCAPPLARVTLTIRDRTRADSVSWTRCSDRSLPTLSGAGAGPDAQASRVVQAAALVRSFTLDLQKSFRYQYTGSMPFATVERGGESATEFTTPRVIEDESNWRAFWTELTGGDSSPPAIDFEADLVLVGVIGPRDEAGDSAEIRGVFPVAGGTQISLWERKAGHFCTPGRTLQVPYHVVVTPRLELPRPVFFSDVSLDTVPCG